MDPDSADMLAYYAARAPYYDAIYHRPERHEDIAFLTTHLPERLRGRSVLEIACGTGYWTQHIAPAAKQVVATDLSAEPLDFARLRPGNRAVTFHRIDAYALPARLGTFTGAFAGLWFSHVPVQARSRFLAGLQALLQPGARVLILDNSEVQLRDFPIVETDADGNTFQLRRLQDGSVHRVLKNFPTQADLRALLEPLANSIRYQQLQNFWLLEYEL